MTSTLTPPGPVYGRVTAHPRHRRGRRRPLRPLSLSLLSLLLVVALGLAALVAYRFVTDDSRRDYLGAGGWPDRGQAAIAIDGNALTAGPGQRPAPIASMAKVMTAYLVLQAYPLRPGQDGFALSISDADVARTAQQRAQDQSVVGVAAGETLTQRQALLALLLPSANNVAEFLARRVAGSVPAFVARMNATAQRLRMWQTHYADPSGFAARTVSTAVDQVTLARVVARDATFSALVATRSARLPVEGTVHNTDTLLGHDGFVGTKTGSHDAAGGCFMFRVVRQVDGRRTEVIGVVMGQRGHSLVRAGLYAAQQLVARRVAVS